MLQKILAIIGILGALYGVATYGSWFVASFYTWDSNGKHGCMELGVSLTEITADIKSGKRTRDGYVHTKITKGTPILFWVRNSDFDIPERQQSGRAKLTLGFNEISLEQFYGGNEPFIEPEGKIIFKRASKCSETGVTYNH